MRLGRACGQPPSVGLSIGEVGGVAGAAILPPALRNQVRRGRSRLGCSHPEALQSWLNGSSGLDDRIAAAGTDSVPTRA